MAAIMRQDPIENWSRRRGPQGIDESHAGRLTESDDPPRGKRSAYTQPLKYPHNEQSCFVLGSVPHLDHKDNGSIDAVGSKGRNFILEANRNPDRDPVAWGRSWASLNHEERRQLAGTRAPACPVPCWVLENGPWSGAWDDRPPVSRSTAQRRPDAQRSEVGPGSRGPPADLEGGSRRPAEQPPASSFRSNFRTNYTRQSILDEHRQYNKGIRTGYTNRTTSSREAAATDALRPPSYIRNAEPDRLRERESGRSYYVSEDPFRGGLRKFGSGASTSMQAEDCLQSERVFTKRAGDRGGVTNEEAVRLKGLIDGELGKVTGARGRRKLEHAGSERAGEEVGDLRNRRKKQVSPSHLGGANPKFSPQKRSALGQVEDAARRGIIPSEYRRRAVQRGGKKHWPLAMGVIDSTQCQTRMIRKTEA